MILGFLVERVQKYGLVIQMFTRQGVRGPSFLLCVRTRSQYDHVILVSSSLETPGQLIVVQGPLSHRCSFGFIPLETGLTNLRNRGNHDTFG